AAQAAVTVALVRMAASQRLRVMVSSFRWSSCWSLAFRGQAGSCARAAGRLLLPEAAEFRAGIVLDPRLAVEHQGRPLRDLVGGPVRDLRMVRVAGGGERHPAAGDLVGEAQVG